MSQNRLQGLEARNDSANHARYSSLVKSLKFFFPLLAIGLIGILLIWPQLKGAYTKPLNQADIRALKQAETENRLLTPVFNTEDEKGRPMTITAKEAIQRRSNDNIVELNTPSATLKGDERQTTLNADQGQYDQNKKIIRLENNVIVQDSENNILETEHLTADIENNRAYSNSPTKLTTPQGTIEGKGVTIENNGAKTIFKGPAKAVIQ